MMTLDADGSERRLRMYGFSPAQAYGIACAIAEVSRALRLDGDRDNRLRNAVDRIAAKRRLESVEADAVNRILINRISPSPIKRFATVCNLNPSDLEREMGLGRIELDGEKLFTLVRSLTYSWDGAPHGMPFGSSHIVEGES